MSHPKIPTNPLIEINNIITEYCDKYEKYILDKTSFFRSYDTDGYITINCKCGPMRINYYFEKNERCLRFYEESKYNPICEIKNILFYSKGKIFEKIDNVLYKFVSSKLKSKRKVVFNDLLFEICDKKCLDKKYSDKKRKLSDISSEKNSEPTLEQDNMFEEFLKLWNKIICLKNF